jgi:3D (Asp-Asp-Asp) domain-containing protein
MKHLKVKSSKTMLLITIPIVIILSVSKMTPTEIVYAKSVDEQICIQSKEEGSTSAVAGIVSVVNTSLNNAKNLEVQEQDINIVSATEYEFKNGWTKTGVNVRKEPDVNSEKLDLYFLNTQVSYADFNDEWAIIQYNDTYGYIFKKYISDEEIEVYTGPVLTKSKGVNYGPSGKETYYNLPMHNVVRYMKDLGYDYEYWVRSDGVKMYGDYVMIAADLSIRPKGTVIQTSLGLGIVCDTGDFVYSGNSSWIDIATSW